MKDSKARISEFFTENGSYKLVALFITLVLWVTFLGRREGVHTGEVALEYLTKESIVVANELPSKVELRVSGPQMRLKRVSEQMETSLTVDLTNYTTGQFPIAIPVDRLQLPLGTKILSVSPERINVQLDRLMVASIPVEVVFQRNRRRGWRVTAVKPNNIVVKGAASQVGRIEKIKTTGIDVTEFEDRKKEKTIEVSLPLEFVQAPGVLPLADQSVVVELSRR